VLQTGACWLQTESLMLQSGECTLQAGVIMFHNGGSRFLEEIVVISLLVQQKFIFNEIFVHFMKHFSHWSIFNELLHSSQQ
jgi:hypothetical protein